MTDFKKTIEHIKVIEAAGCTPFPEHVDLDLQEIHVQSDESYESMAKVWGKCEPACHAEIIAWYTELEDWFSLTRRDDLIVIESCIDQPPAEKLFFVAQYFEGSEKVMEKEFTTRFAACLALIEAVAGRLGEPNGV